MFAHIKNIFIPFLFFGCLLSFINGIMKIPNKECTYIENCTIGFIEYSILPFTKIYKYTDSS